MINLPSPKRAGDTLKHTEFNQLIAAVQQHISVPHGEWQLGMLGIGETKHAKIHVVCEAKEAFPAFSVFSITAPLTDINFAHAEAFAVSHDNGATPFLLATNGPFEIAINQQFTATLLDHIDAVPVRFDATDIPEVGKFCGAQLGQSRVAGTHTFGLVCVSAPAVVNGVNTVRVVRSASDIALVGKVMNVITPGAGLSLGTGKVIIHYRIGSALVPAVPPGGVALDLWIVDVWNTQPLSFPVDAIVELANRTGIGLCVASSNGVTTTVQVNPGVVTVQITGVSPCIGETFDELGYHVFLATILSRPFGSIAEMRKERSGQLTIFDPTGCILDSDYLVADFLGYASATIAFVSLMYGGGIFDEEYNFKATAAGLNYVIPSDTYETFRPADSCKPFGFIGGARTGYTASIGPIVPDGITTFQVELPEQGVYEVAITYGDATDATDNELTLQDGDTVIKVLTGTSMVGQTWLDTGQYNFVSANAPLLKIVLSNASDRDTRIVKLEILQIDPPTQWEVINRCCIPKDLE